MSQGPIIRTNRRPVLEDKPKPQEMADAKYPSMNLEERSNAVRPPNPDRDTNVPVAFVAIREKRRPNGTRAFVVVKGMLGVNDKAYDVAESGLLTLTDAMGVLKTTVALSVFPK